VIKIANKSESSGGGGGSSAATAAAGTTVKKLSHSPAPTGSPNRKVITFINDHHSMV